MRQGLKRKEAVLLVVLGILWIGLGGCAPSAPFLIPTSTAPDSSAPALHREQLKISVRPVVTTGFRSQDRERFQVDLSAYFTAFHIEMQNGLPRPVRVDASRIFLKYNDQAQVPALGESESIEYYRHGDRSKPELTLVPKPRRMQKEEIAKIHELRFQSAIIPPGGRHAGVVYFKKIQDRDCKGVTLRMTEVEIQGEEDPYAVQFNFRCSQ